MVGHMTGVSPGVFADLAALRGFWHPVGFSTALDDGPMPALLLGEPLVLWRGQDGTVRVLSDVCVHRGTALSLGGVNGDEIVCAYHGWRYRADGRCVAIPQLADPTRVPAKARVAAFRAQERYGLIWVALEEPRWPLPEVPELEDGDWAVVRAGPYAWGCDAARQVENFTDFGHFPWVHPGLLGDPDAAGRPCAPGRHRGPRAALRDRPSGGAEHRRFPGLRQRAGRTAGAAQQVRAAPAVHDRAAAGLGRRARHDLLVRLPAGRRRPLRGYVVIGRNYNLDQDDQVISEFEDTIFGQDQVVVESQRPDRVPFDLAAELHLKFDAVAVAYRKAMRTHGLTTDSPG